MIGIEKKESTEETVERENETKTWTEINKNKIFSETGNCTGPLSPPLDVYRNPGILLCFSKRKIVTKKNKNKKIKKK